MNSPRWNPSDLTSPVKTQKGTNASLLDDDTLGTYAPYDIKDEWGTRFPGGPQPSTEDTAYPEYQAMYNNSVQSYEQTYSHAPLVPRDQEDPAYNREDKHDASSTLKESPETLAQPGGSSFGKSVPQKNFVRKLYEYTWYHYINDDCASDITLSNQDAERPNGPKPHPLELGWQVLRH